MDNLLSSASLSTKGSTSLEDRIDQILAIVVEVRDQNRKHQEEIKQLTIKVIALEKENMTIKKELRNVKESANRYELSARSLTVRILGLPVFQEEANANSTERNKIAVKNVYDRFLKPIFNTAKAKGFISTVPQLNTAISEGYRLNSNAKDKRGNLYPPPLLIKFTDKSFRSAIFRCKKEVLASLAAEGAAGGFNPFIVEDLTTATLSKMKELKEDDRIEKVWSTEGSIRFTLVADPAKVRKFPGAFTPINEAIK